MTEQYAIECRQITKVFGSVVANDKIDLTVRYGEIMALLGENGSGKTTLMNMLSGIYHPDAGSILVGGKEVSINSLSRRGPDLYRRRRSFHSFAQRRFSL